MSIYDYISDLYLQHSPRVVANIIKPKREEVLEFFNNQFSLAQCLFLIKNSMKSAPFCLCGKQCKPQKDGFSKTCGDEECFKNHQRSKNFENKEKRESTTLSKYGKRVFTQTQEFKEKTKKTIEDKHGVKFYTQSNDFREKFIKTSKQNFGEQHPMKSQIVKSKVRNKNKSNFELKFPELSFDALRGVADENKSIYDILKHLYPDIEVNSSDYNRLSSILRNLQLPYKISPHMSEGELLVYEFILEVYNGEVIRNTRKVLKSGKELDIYIPEFNLAIEYNGDYWHSEDIHKNSKNLLHKLDECESMGITLLNIFDSEWIDSKKRDIWKSLIKHKLKKQDNKIWARKCSIYHTTRNKSHDEFFTNNHLQGKSNSGSIIIEMIHNNIVVALMQLGKSRWDKLSDYEIIRFAVIKNTHIPGAFTKMINYVSKVLNIKSIVTYANRRWSYGNVYKVSGSFAFSHNSQENYHYVKGNKVISRLNAQKHKLKEFLQEYDDNLSEKENMRKNGWFVVYDCGNMIFRMKE